MIKTFRSKPDFMQHRKKQQRESVKYWICNFDEKKCWCIHTKCKEINTFDINKNIEN